MKDTVPDYFIVLKILTVPLEEDLFNDIQKIELSRLLEKSSTEAILYMQRNFSFSEINSVYIKIYKKIFPKPKEDTLDGLYYFKNFCLKEYEEEVLSFKEFIEKLQNIEDSGERVCWVVWNGLSYDIAKINFDILRTGAKVELIPTRKFSLTPVFDVMSWVYSWGMSNSFLLTCDNFGISINSEYQDKDFLVMLYRKGVGEEMNEYLRTLGNHLSSLFLKVVEYYF